MSNTQRCGSILLLCISIVTVLMMIAFAFVRVMSLQGATNESEARMLLAREAASSGLNHAIEQIIRDHVSGPFTRAEDSAHAAFEPLYRPFESDFNTDQLPGGPVMVNVDDIPAENNIFQTLGGPYNDWETLAWGQHNFDGRGRFYEPEFYNRAQNGFDPAATEPTIPVRFGTTWNPTDALPDRSEGIFYDADLKRIYGDPRVARTIARYRLRYAIDMVDLDGEFLINGDPAVDYRDLNQAGPLAVDTDPWHTLTAEERVLRWKLAIPALTYCSSYLGTDRGHTGGADWGSGFSGGARVEHLFMGRGIANNFDRASGSNAPVTFPYMYRDGKVDEFLDTTSNIYPATSIYLTNPSGGADIPSGQRLIHGLTGPAFSFSNYDAAISGIAWDKNNDGDGRAMGLFTPFGRGLVKGNFGRWSGKVDVPWCVNVMTAPTGVVYSMIASYMPPGAIGTWHKEKAPTNSGFTSAEWFGLSYASELTGTRDLFVKEISPAFIRYTTPTSASSPFITPDYNNPATRTADERYPGIMGLNGLGTKRDPVTGAPVLAVDGSVQTTWVNDDLGTYLRAETRGDALANLGNEIDATGRPTVVRKTNLAAKEIDVRPNPSQPRNWTSYWMLSGNVGTSASRTAGTPPAIIPPLPQPLNWDPTVTYRINTTVFYPVDGNYYKARRDHSNWAPDQVADATHVGTIPWQATTLPARNGWESDVGGAHPNSIWSVIGGAMSTTIGIARNQYSLYPNPTSNVPASIAFDGGPWPGAPVASIRDLDALFVANLGSHINQPNNPTPTVAWRPWSGYVASVQVTRYESFTPTWNLASLRTATTNIEVMTEQGNTLPRILALGTPMQVDIGKPQATLGTYAFPLMAWNDPGEPRFKVAIGETYTADERTSLIELLINDFRLSFFGSSPDYHNDFRALDLNGDGRAHCSGFPSIGTSREQDLHIDQYTTSIDADGVASNAVSDYFSTTGVFFIGKSRFWRIMVRGEVWDNVLKTTVNGAQLDTVLSIDPVNAEQEWATPVGSPDPAAGQYSTHVLYQRWFFNPYRGLLPRQQH